MIKNNLASLKLKNVVILLSALLTITLALPSLQVFASGFPYGEGDYSECPYSADTDNCDISLTNNGFSLFLPVTPSASGSCTVQNDQVTVSTYDPYGYSLTLNDASTSSNLVALNGSGNYISPTTGTLGSPIALVDAWGYRVDGSGGFGSGPTTSETNAAPNSSLHFAKVQPSSGTPDTIATTSTISTSSTTSIWYGVCLDDSSTATPGSYTTTVLYTATAN